MSTGEKIAISTVICPFSDFSQLSIRSQTCWLPAACFIRPRSTEEVALILKIITRVGNKFAIRGRGHNPNPGFSSIDGSGVLLDLQDLNLLVFDLDGVLRAGPGNAWGDLWNTAEANNRTVWGAREQRVGISGCLLGGNSTAPGSSLSLTQARWNALFP